MHKQKFVREKDLEKQADHIFWSRRIDLLLMNKKKESLQTSEFSRSGRELSQNKRRKD